MNIAILQAADKYIGLTEIKGPAHEERILEMFRSLGLPWFKEDEIPWCGVAQNCVLRDAGMPYMKGEDAARAMSFLEYGTEVKDWKDAEPGDICVFKREGGGHVATLLGFSADRTKVFIVGGNQGNKFTISIYPTTNLVSIRRAVIKESKVIRVPASPVATRAAIVDLQQALKHFNFYTKVADGDFGPNTLQAVLDFQKANKLPLTGSYDKLTYEKLFSLMNQ